MGKKQALVLAGRMDARSSSMGEQASTLHTAKPGGGFSQCL